MKTVSNQQDLDSALADGARYIVINAQQGIYRVESTTEQTVNVFGEAMVYAYGNAHVLADATAVVYAFDDTFVVAQEHATVRAFSRSRVALWDDAAAVSYQQSRVRSHTDKDEAIETWMLHD